MEAQPRPDAWLTGAAYGVLWLLLALISLLAPWFVVFAVMFWTVVPILVLTAAGLVAISLASRAVALAVARGMAVVFAISIVPSGLVVWGAFSQMGDNYF